MSPVHLSKEQVQEIAALLKSSREKQRENLPEVAFRIALSPSQLRAIEAGDLRPFYSAGYFLQAAERYANFLNIKLPQHTIKSSSQEVAISTSIAQESIQNNNVHDAVAQQAANAESEHAGNSQRADRSLQIAMPKMGAGSWGWLSFGAAALITVGIVKISFDKPAAPEATVIATATSATPAATVNESGAAVPTVAAPTPAALITPGVANSAATSAASPVATSAPTTSTPVTATTPQDRLSSPSKTINALDSGPSDSRLESQTPTWVQLVKTNGEKTNLKIEPGQKIEFAAGTTAAVVFGQPDKAVLKVKDKTVNLKPFITADNPSRALVILNQIRD